MENMGCMSVEEKWNSKYTYCWTETFFVPMTENQSGRLYSSRLSIYVLIVKYWLDRNYVYTYVYVYAYRQRTMT